MRTRMQIYNVSEELDRTFGVPGTESRRKAEDQAWEEYNAQILLDARKESGMTQSELADKSGLTRAIYRVWKGDLSSRQFQLFIAWFRPWDLLLS